MAKAHSAKAHPKLPLEEREQLSMPVFSCRHRALKAAVWQNDSTNGVFYNVTVSRSYKDGDTWKESSSFGYDDILPIAELLRTCHGFISREIAKAKSEAKTTPNSGK
jgi:hypothetical protein